MFKDLTASEKLETVIYLKIARVVWRLISSEQKQSYNFTLGGSKFQQWMFVLSIQPLKGEAKKKIDKRHRWFCRYRCTLPENFCSCLVLCTYLYSTQQFDEQNIAVGLATSLTNAHKTLAYMPTYLENTGVLCYHSRNICNSGSLKYNTENAKGNKFPLVHRHTHIHRYTHTPASSPRFALYRTTVSMFAKRSCHKTGEQGPFEAAFNISHIFWCNIFTFLRFQCMKVEEA